MSLKSDTQDKIKISWKIASRLPANLIDNYNIGVAGPVTGICQDMLIIAGGANFPDAMPWEGGEKIYYDEVLVLKKVSNENFQWLYLQESRLVEKIAYAANVSLINGVVYMGGENKYGISNKVFFLTIETQSGKLVSRRLPDLPLALANAVASTFENYIFIAGGENGDFVSNKFYRLDLNNLNSGWKKLPDVPVAISHGVMVNQSDGISMKLFIIGGRSKINNEISVFYSSVFSFDIEKNIWEMKQSMPDAKAAGTGIAYDNQYILLFGGDNGITFNKTEQHILSIAKEKNKVRRQNLVEQKNKIQASHPGFKKDVWVYNTKTNNWMKSDNIPFDMPATTTAVKWGNAVVIPSGEIRAGVRTSQVLLGTFR